MMFLCLILNSRVCVTSSNLMKPCYLFFCAHILYILFHNVMWRKLCLIYILTIYSQTLCINIMYNKKKQPILGKKKHLIIFWNRRSFIEKNKPMKIIKSHTNFTSFHLQPLLLFTTTVMLCNV